MSDQSPGGASPFEEPDFSKFAAADDEGELETEEAEDLVVAEVEDDEDPELDGNTAEGGSAAAVLEHLATSIVDDKESVVVETKQARGQTRLYLHVASSDMGRIIGRRGRTAQALRTLVRAAAAADGEDVFVEIVD